MLLEKALSAAPGNLSIPFFGGEIDLVVDEDVVVVWSDLPVQGNYRKGHRIYR